MRTRRRLVAAGLVVTGLAMSALQSSVSAVGPAPGNVSNGLALWLDASDPLFTGTLPTNGTNVTTWKDKSGNGRDAVVNPNGVGQANTPAVFESAPSGFNGRPALRFNRIDDDSGSVYRVGSLDIRAVTNPDVTVFAVYRPVALSNFNGLWGNDDGNWDRFFLTYHSAFGDGVNDGIVGLGPTLAGETIADSGSTAAPSLFAISYGGNVVNGTNVGDTNGSYVYFNCNLQRTFTDSTDASMALSDLSVGWDGDNSVFDGYVAEMIVYNRVLNTQEVSSVNTYLASKYNLATGCASFVTTTTTTTTTTLAPTTTTTPVNPASSTSTTSTTTSTTSSTSPGAPLQVSNRLPQTGSRSVPMGVLSLLLVVAGLIMWRVPRDAVRVRARTARTATMKE